MRTKIRFGLHALVCGCLLLGCGGGTRGTGVGDSQAVGTFGVATYVDGGGAAEVEISVASLGVSAVTDSEGAFAFEEELPADGLLFEFSSEGVFVGEVSIESPEEGCFLSQVQFVFGDSFSSVEVVSPQFNCLGNLEENEQ